MTSAQTLKSIIDQLIAAMPLQAQYDHYNDYCANIKQSNAELLSYLQRIHNTNKQFFSRMTKTNSFEQYVETDLRLHIVLQLMDSNLSYLFDDMDDNDIAEVLNVRRELVRSTLHMANRKLKAARNRQFTKEIIDIMDDIEEDKDSCPTSDENS